MITEQIFAWPGIGRLTIESINARDFPVVMAVTLVASLAVVGANLLVDLSYSRARSADTARHERSLA